MILRAHRFVLLACATTFAATLAHSAELVGKRDVIKDNDGNPSTAQAICKSITNEVRPNVVMARPDGGSVLCRIGDGKPDDDSEQHTGLVEKGCPPNSKEAGGSQCQCDRGFKASGGQCVGTKGADAAVEAVAGTPAKNTESQPAVVAPRPEVAQRMRPEGALTGMANEVKALGQQKGATVEIALATLPDGREILVAGINSGANGWTRAQRAKLTSWGVNIAPDSVPKGLLGQRDGGAVHAEENIGAYLDEIGARGQRWSRAVVGDAKSGGGSYVCERCQNIISRAGGHVEEPAPKVPRKPLDKPLRPPGK